MANAIYPAIKAAWMTEGSTNIGLTGAAVLKAALVDTAVYTYSAAHQFYSSVSAGVVGTPQAIGAVTVTNGTLDGNDVTFSAVTGASVEALVLYIDTGNAATSRLVAYFDTGVSGLPVTPNGGDIVIAWDGGANKIFTL